MKIAILGFNKIKYMPYINFYLDNIDKKKHEVHILYWNRDMRDEDLEKYQDCVFHGFKCYQEDDVSKLTKINSFIKYRKYVKKVIEQEKFDFLFLLHSFPAVLTVDMLKKSYSGKYIFDYRDSTYESFAPFKKIVATITRNACATFVSSDAFRRFLPEDCKGKIHTSHNLLVDSLQHRDEKEKYGTKSDKIRIAFWGFIRHEEINRELIKKIALDSRFELHYYGREQQVALNLKQYAKEICASNIYFHGEYKPEDRYEFVRNTDIIHNVYKDANMMLAMGNKYYDAAIFYIPLMSMQDSFMAEKAQKAGIGFSVDPWDENFLNKLYESYCGLDRNEFVKNCDVELSRVCNEYCKGNDVIKVTISGEK